MTNYLKKIHAATSSSEVRKNIYLVTVITSLFVLALAIRGPQSGGRIISDNKGNITGIERESLETGEKYEMRLQWIRNGKVSERNVSLDLKSITDRSGNEADIKYENKEETEIAKFEAEIDGILTEIEYSQEETINLPSSLSDGTEIRWYQETEDESQGIVLVIAFYLILIFIVIKNEVDKEINEDSKTRHEILHNLPRFCNQMFLMMNAGMILSDAFERICNSYREIDDEDLSRFEKEMIALSNSNTGHRLGAAAILTEYAAGYSVKELTRIASILAVNERRGSDVVDKLAQESNFLWNERKLIAREKGRAIDTKMAYPLGALLIVLIVITMAPALLNI